MGYMLLGLIYYGRFRGRTSMRDCVTVLPSSNEDKFNKLSKVRDRLNLGSFQPWEWGQ